MECADKWGSNMKTSIVILCSMLCLIYMDEKCKVYEKYSIDELHHEYIMIRQKIVQVAIFLIISFVGWTVLNIIDINTSPSSKLDLLYSIGEQLESFVNGGFN